MEAIEQRKSGIACAEGLPWGTHFCQFFSTKKDLLDILVPYFKAGLENNEYCLWLTSAYLTKEEGIAALKDRIPATALFLESGQIDFIPATEWYFKDGSFDRENTFKAIEKKYAFILAQGYAGLRASGGPFWIDNSNEWAEFRRYEAEVNDHINGLNVIALCTYSSRKCNAAEIHDVVKNHQFCIAKVQNRWESFRTSICDKPKPENSR